MRTVDCRCVTRSDVDCRCVSRSDHAQKQLVRGAKVHLSWGPPGPVNIFGAGVRNIRTLKAHVWSKYFHATLQLHYAPSG